MISEPAAAALDYAADDVACADGSLLLVYDLGGGTFDVALLRRRRRRVRARDRAVRDRAARRDRLRRGGLPATSSRTSPPRRWQTARQSRRGLSRRSAGGSRGLLRPRRGAPGRASRAARRSPVGRGAGGGRRRRTGSARPTPWASASWRASEVGTLSSSSPCITSSGRGANRRAASIGRKRRNARLHSSNDVGNAGRAHGADLPGVLEEPARLLGPVVEVGAWAEQRRRPGPAGRRRRRRWRSSRRCSCRPARPRSAWSRAIR